ncbi:MAG TPA: hypothetical protein VG755_02180 [Nannocystaceae bacterium]|nr:hypothetical protein [Nannocystaceae bacterium]
MIGLLVLGVLASCSVDADGSATGLGATGSAATTGTTEDPGGDAANDDSSTSDAPASDDDSDPSDDDSGTTPESSGSSSGAVETGDASSDSSSSDAASATGEPLGEWGYGSCSADCPADMCIVIEGFEGSFCTTSCVDGACPQAPDGDALAQCLLGPDLTMDPINCVLTCHTDAQECPSGMTCVDAMMGGNAGICLWQS